MAREKICGIYKIQSIIKPDRIYIGSSVDILKRWEGHIFDLKKNKHRSQRLQNHCNKYGLEDIVFSIVEKFVFISKEHILSREQYYIDSLNPYFCICKIAGNRLGYKTPPEVLLKQSIAKMGDKNPMYGKSSGMKGKIPWNKGLKMTEEYKNKHKDRYVRPTLSENVKKSWIKRRKEGKVGCRDEKGRFISSK